MGSSVFGLTSSVAGACVLLFLPFFVPSTHTSSDLRGRWGTFYHFVSTKLRFTTLFVVHSFFRTNRTADRLTVFVQKLSTVMMFDLFRVFLEVRPFLR